MLSAEVKSRLLKPAKENGRTSKIISEATQNPSIEKGQYRSAPFLERVSNGNGNGKCDNRKRSTRRYFATVEDTGDWPPELTEYNRRFAQTLEGIKRRHDSVVATIGNMNIMSTPI